MPQFIVQKLLPNRLDLTWTDITNHNAKHGDDVSLWEAKDAGDAFNQAVLQNTTKTITSTSYRVLPFEGGAVFNVNINVDLVTPTHRAENVLVQEQNPPAERSPSQCGHPQPPPTLEDAKRSDNFIIRRCDECGCELYWSIDEWGKI